MVMEHFIRECNRITSKYRGKYGDGSVHIKNFDHKHIQIGIVVNSYTFSQIIPLDHVSKLFDLLTFLEKRMDEQLNILN